MALSYEAEDVVFPDHESFRWFRRMASERPDLYGGPREGGGWHFPSDPRKGRIHHLLQASGGRVVGLKARRGARDARRGRRDARHPSPWPRPRFKVGDRVVSRSAHTRGGVVTGYQHGDRPSDQILYSVRSDRGVLHHVYERELSRA